MSEDSPHQITKEARQREETRLRHGRLRLRGCDFREQRMWLKPHLGFLVWDPDNTGQITSARLLFGGYTFEIFWRDGFTALRSLDDNGDGKLTGRELEGAGASEQMIRIPPPDQLLLERNVYSFQQTVPRSGAPLGRTVAQRNWSGA